jgi:pantoate--beta-alanine ligase
VRTVKEMRGIHRQLVIQNKTLGLVPTMGALHDGHLTLVRRSLEENDITVVSVFVNPSQFAPHEDLDAYPRNLDSDLEKLNKQLSNEQQQMIVFNPTIKEMYPSGISLDIGEQVGAFVEVKGLSHQLEGSVRPHFFRGVATIVTKLLNAVTPDVAYFGQKDIQQTVVVRRLTQDLLIPTRICVGPTVREPNGLAMSSRNEYLSPESRDKAQILYKALRAGEAAYGGKVASRAVILNAVHDTLRQETSIPIEIEYVELSHPDTLLNVAEVSPGSGAILSAAIRVPNNSGGMTRILDNVILT